MIVTVTMNPAVDKTIRINELQRGRLNRIDQVELDAGGKGINVSKTIHMLGGYSVALGFLGGSASSYILDALRDTNIQMDFVRVEGETRTNIKIMEQDGLLTEINEGGPMVHQEQVDALMKKLEIMAAPDVWFVFSGSVPYGVTMDIYEKMIRCVKEKGAKTILDADGQLFRNGLKAGPDIIKPNRYELEQYFGASAADDEILLQMGKKLIDMGVGMVAITLGQNGAIFMNDQITYGVPAIETKINSSVGAGDALLGGLVYGLHKGLGLESSIKMAVAASAGAVMTEGTKPPTAGMVRELENRVNLFVISS